MGLTKPPQAKVGRKFGMLTPTVGFHAKNTRDKTKLYYKCDCDCGIKDHIVLSGNLRSVGGSNSCGCNHWMGNVAKDITDQRFGLLTAISPTEKRWRKNIIWLFKCDCGKNAELPLGEVTALKRQSCGCKRKNPDRKEALWIKTRANALRHSLDYGSVTDIDLNAYIDLVTQDCYYCGSPPTTQIKDAASDLILFRNGLDRVDSNDGYVLTNVVPCCEKCNRAKLNLSYDDWINLISKVYEHFIQSGKCQDILNKKPTSNDVG